MTESRRLSVIVFTDIVGFSHLMQTDEARAFELLEEHNTIVAAAIGEHGGRTIKTAGDSFMAAFESAAAAVTATAQIQQKLAERNATQPDDRHVHIRIGVHAGDVVFTTDSAGADDALGDGVNVASRVEAQAGAGQVFVSHDIFSITYDRVPFGYRDIGVRDLKNISRPIHIYELLWDPARAAEADAEPPRVGEPASRGGRVGWIVAIIAVAAAIGIIITSSAPPAPESLSGRPKLAVLGVADATGDDRLGQIRIDRILTDALEQKFYEFGPVQLVSPLRVAKLRRAMEPDVDEQALAEVVVEETGGRITLSGNLSHFGGQFILNAELNDMAAEDPLLDQVRLQHPSEQGLLGLVDSVSLTFQRRLISVLGIGTVDDVVLAPMGEMMTESLSAYSLFVKGHELFRGGRLLEGAELLTQAVEIDPQFSMAASEAACAFSFAKDHDSETVYFQKALEIAGPRMKQGMSKPALIFQGNAAWIEGSNPDTESARADSLFDRSCDRYHLITELYPDDPDGYYYLGLCEQYLRGSGGPDRRQHLDRAVELYARAAKLKPGYFPIYFDWAQSLKSRDGDAAALRLVGQYLREYPEGPGAESAQAFVEQLRGGG